MSLTTGVLKLFDRQLDRMVRTRVRVLARPRSSFRVCGMTGLVSAVLLATMLIGSRGLTLWPMAAIVLSAVATFFALAMLTKVVTGQEKLIYYHHEIAVLSVAAVTLWLLRRPVLPYLDATLLGVGLFLVCGRVGCLMVGCCHGRPCRCGVRYGADHVAEGFTRHYVGIRLFPIQAVESLWALGVVIIGTTMVLAGSPPGTALAWYIVTYDVGRFCFEFARGDSDRPYHMGFSEAQWISLVLTWAVVWAERRGVLPDVRWHVAAAALLTAGASLVAARRRLKQSVGESYRLSHPRHVRSLAEALDLLYSASGAPVVGSLAQDLHAQPVFLARTCQGVSMSHGCIRRPNGMLEHYTLSGSGAGGMSPATAAIVAGLIARLRHVDEARPRELVPGKGGVYHFLVHPPPCSPGTGDDGPPGIAPATASSTMQEEVTT
jgi:prolipoprotein diacylglyceryltransferase